MVRFFTLVLIFFSFHAEASWTFPNTPMTGIGDPGSFYLNKRSLTLHLFNNDYLGETDKLMTASGSLFLYLNSGKSHGWEISVQRRLIQPIIKVKAGHDVFDPPKGVYGDQLESRVGYSYVKGIFKLEAAVSAEYYAGLDGHNITRFIHKVIGAKDQTDIYGEKLDREDISGSLGLGLVLNDHVLFMIYGHEGPLMREAIGRLSLKFGERDFQLGLQGEVAQQFKSVFYEEDIKDYRYGYGLSMKFGWYQFTANYVSPYLKYDKYGQYFISPFIASWEF